MQTAWSAKLRRAASRGRRSSRRRRTRGRARGRRGSRAPRSRRGSRPGTAGSRQDGLESRRAAGRTPRQRRSRRGRAARRRPRRHFELVEQLHRLEDAQRLADGDLVADGDEGRVVGRRRPGRTCRPSGSRRRRGASARCRAPGRRRRGGGRRRGGHRHDALLLLAQRDARAVLLDRQLREAGLLEQRHERRMRASSAGSPCAPVGRALPAAHALEQRHEASSPNSATRQSSSSEAASLPTSSRASSMSAGTTLFRGLRLGQRAHGQVDRGRASAPTRRMAMLRTASDVPVQRRPLRTWSMAWPHDDSPTGGAMRRAAELVAHAADLVQHLLHAVRRAELGQVPLGARDEARGHAIDRGEQRDVGGERRRQRLAGPELPVDEQRGLPGREPGRSRSRRPMPSRVWQSSSDDARCVGTATGYAAAAIGSAPARAASTATASAVPPGPCT